jgi:hypothetical protein
MRNRFIKMQGKISSTNLDKMSIRFKNLFLLTFTQELIKNSGGYMIRLNKILEKAQSPEEERVKEIIKSKHVKEDLVPRTKEMNEPFHFRSKKPAVFSGKRKRVLRIPEQRLPPQFSYLKPTASNAEIDLGKLNPLIQDPVVNEIECNGPGEKIYVRGSMGHKPTAITLSKEEIREVIDKFSQESKIPVQDGVYNVAVGKLNFHAIVSETVGSKFIIKKLDYGANKIF